MLKTFTRNTLTNRLLLLQVFLNHRIPQTPDEFSIDNKNAVINLYSTDILEKQFSYLKLNTNFEFRKKHFRQLIAPVEKDSKNCLLTEIKKNKIYHLIITNVNFNSKNTKPNLTILKNCLEIHLHINYH